MGVQLAAFVDVLIDCRPDTAAVQGANYSRHGGTSSKPTTDLAVSLLNMTAR